jgi:hypothetical protein
MATVLTNLHVAHADADNLPVFCRVTIPRLVRPPAKAM